MNKIKQYLTKENIVKGLKWFFFSYIWLAILMFIIDIVSKTLVKNNMAVGDSINLIPNFLSITYSQNSGMAFGMDFNNQTANTVVFILISVIGTIIIGFCSWKYWKKMGQVGKASVMLMLSGTVGNLIDRAFYVKESGAHFVVDFIQFHFFPAIFNIADSCLTVGTIMLIIYIIVMDIKAEKSKKENQLVMQGEVKANEQEESSQELPLNNDETTDSVENKKGEKQEKVEENYEQHDE